MIQTISFVIVFTILGKILGFLRELLLSYYFGASGISDAYLISQTIPGTIFQFVGTGLATCFIPVFFKVKTEKDIEQANYYTDKIITLILLFSTIIIILIWSFTFEAVKIFASGFEGETLNYAMVFTRIGICTLYISTFIYVFNSYLQANGKFIPTAFSAVPYSICIIIAIMLGHYKNIYFLSIGSATATIVQLLFLCIPVFKLKYFYKPNFNFKDKYIKNFFMLLTPVIIGVSVNEINVLVDRTIASQVATGGISALTYANSLIMFIQGGLSQSVATVCYPKISSMVSTKDYSGAKKLTANAIIALIVLLFPITMGFIILAEPIVSVLFGRGAFDINAAAMTQKGVVFYAMGLPFLGIRELLSRYYYAFEDTKTPMKNSIIGVITNIVFNIAFSKIWGIAGLAFATTLSAIVTSTILWIECKYKIASGTPYISLKEILKIIIATALMALEVKILSCTLPFSNLPKLIIIVLLSIIMYTSIMFLIRSDISILLLKTVKSKFHIGEKHEN